MGITLLAALTSMTEVSRIWVIIFTMKELFRGEFAFTPRFSGTATAGYRWDDYPDDEPSRTDKTITATAGLQYQALRWMALNLDYTFRDLSSDDDADEYTENRVIFSITLTPDQPFRLMQ